MAIVLPLASTDKLLSSAVLVGQKDGFPIFVSTLHQIGQCTEFKIGIPPHLGNISSIQEYPIDGVQAIDVDMIKVDPIHDLAFFKGKTKVLCELYVKVPSGQNIPCFVQGPSIAGAVK